MPIVGEQQVVNLSFAEGDDPTLIQLVAPPGQPVKFLGWSLGFPDYKVPKSAPALGRIKLTVERQKGGAFANGGLPAFRVSGNDRPGEPLRGLYRSVVQEEPETVEVLDEHEIDLVSGAIVESDPKTAPVVVAPGEAIGIRLTALTEARIWFLTARHEEV